MKTRQYLKVSYKADWGRTSQDFKLNESHFIKTVLKEIAVGGKCTVELMECDQETYKLKFG